MIDLRCVHADQSESFLSSADVHVDAVPVHHGGDKAHRPLSYAPGGLCPRLLAAHSAQGEGDERRRDDSPHGGSLWHHGDTVIEFTDRAIEILRRSHKAASRFDPDAWIRVFRRRESVEFALATGPGDGDQVIDTQDFRVAVEEGLEGIVAVREPHDQLFLRPAGSDPVPGEVIDAEGH
jgi:hypothetical protein